MKGINKTIVMLSLVSLFTDMASEMLYPVMPVYLRSIGFSLLWIGILEGFAEAVAGLSKSYFGGLSDRSAKRLPFVQAGYALSALSKPMVVLFTNIWWVFYARTLDRLGKGMRTGARDAILSDEAGPGNKGKVFGFHRSMDTLGAVIGPALALCYLYFNPGDYKTLFVIAFFPGIVAVLFTVGVKERKATPSDKKNIGLLHGITFWKQAAPAYRKTAGALLLFALFNSSDVLLLLKIRESGHSDAVVIGIYIFYNLVYALLAFPLGRLADSIGLKKLLVFGLMFFSLTYAGFAVNTSWWGYVVLVACYGVYAASSEGISKALISNLADKKDTAAAIGTFTGFQSLAALFASSFAGWLWYSFGPAVAFSSSAIAAFLVAVYFIRNK
jgi:MFS family permease